MRETIEEYCFDIITAVACVIMFFGVMKGFDNGGFIREPIVRFIQSIVG